MKLLGEGRDENKDALGYWERNLIKLKILTKIRLILKDHTEKLLASRKIYFSKDNFVRLYLFILCILPHQLWKTAFSHCACLDNPALEIKCSQCCWQEMRNIGVLYFLISGSWILVCRKWPGSKYANLLRTFTDL